MKLSPEQRLRIETRHRVSIERHGYKPQALYWSSEEIQLRRFSILADVFMRVHCATECCDVLDVGCGFADLKAWLEREGYAVHYRGIDVSPDMVLAAKSLHPGLEVQVGEVFDLDPAMDITDVVFLSGALNEVVDEPPARSGDYARAAIRHMYDLARHAVAFNLLDARHEWTASRPDLQSFRPDEVVEFCRGFADSVVINDGYLDNDFTVYLFKGI